MGHMVELFLSRQGLPDWFVTNKLPVIGKNGRPTGIMGTVQRFNQTRGLDSPDEVVALAVKRMLERPEAIDSITQLAKELEISHRHFDRRFKDITGLTPKQFLGRSRIQRACQLLQATRDSIGEIALELGYCDQSAFTAQFRRRMGLTPQRYRREFGAMA